MTSKQTARGQALALAAPLLVYLVIFGIGLIYAYFRTFTMMATHDDEGVMMVIVQAFVQDPASYDTIRSIYGPFYLLQKYLVHSAFNLDVSHDVTRFTTIAIWALIAVVGAIFVHRLTRSLVLAALAQMQLLLHLVPLVGSPGHAQEIALLLIAVALLLSSYVATPRNHRLALAGLGFCAGALLLVKINVGVYLGVPLTLAVLSCAPQNSLQRLFLALAGLAALLLPAAIMRNHLGSHSEVQNFCCVVTLAIATCLLASWRRQDAGDLQWSDVAIMSAAFIVTVVLVCGAIVAGGGSLGGIVDAIILRAMKWSSFPRKTEGFQTLLVVVAVGSLSLVLSWRFLLHRLSIWGSWATVVSLVKLVYGCVVIVSVYVYSSSFILQALPLPFIWLVLLEADDQRRPLEGRFPRLLLCFLAVFQVLQLFPKFGAQLSWGGILLIPIALVCIGDAVRTLWPGIRDRKPGLASALSHGAVSILLISAAGVLYYQKAGVTYWKDRYTRTFSLDLPGSQRIHMTRQDLLPLQQLVADIRLQCDGFVSVPGFPSLYFWSEIPPPTVYPFAWALGGLEENGQEELMTIMMGYERPCVVHNGRRTRGWIDRKADTPLMMYINSGFREFREYGPYSLHLDNPRMDAIDAGAES